ncbi:MAG: exodeoxyribonuclease III [Propionibacteriaceae bacterium]|nr:exodeoxyribonuclease III [Propionibacteriaceae bacterium]
MRVASANVNGIRAAQRRGFDTWLADRRPDIVGIQEMRCTPAQVPDGLFDGYHVCFHPGGLAGRNGVALLTRAAPTAVRRGFGHRTDPDGRYVEVDLDLPGLALTVGSVYLPKGATQAGPDADPAKYRRKLSFMASFRAHLTRARRAATASGREFLVMGDFNIAHTRADVRNWRGNQRSEGFLPSEREWFGSLLGPRTLHDVVRRLHPDVEGPYSWWRWGDGPFAKDVGWRIDYQLATPGLAVRAASAWVDREPSPEQRVSDHAPVVVDYTL